MVLAVVSEGLSAAQLATSTRLASHSPHHIIGRIVHAALYSEFAISRSCAKPRWVIVILIHGVLGRLLVSSLVYEIALTFVSIADNVQFGKTIML